MKSYVRFLFAAMFCLFFFQGNVQAQGLKGALNKVKGAISDVAGKATAAATGNEKSTSEGPAKPLAPDVKNSVSQIRSYTGLTKDQFAAKMKGLGFAEATDDMGLGGTVYKSKKVAYSLSVSFGTRGGNLVVRDISRATMSKKPNLASLKTEFLSYGKQCADLKTKFSNAFVKPNNRKSTKVDVRSLENRDAKFLPTFDGFISANEDGSVYDSYTEPDYNYSVSLMYSKAGSLSILVLRVIDKTIESQEG